MRSFTHSVRVAHRYIQPPRVIGTYSGQIVGQLTPVTSFSMARCFCIAPDQNADERVDIALVGCTGAGKSSVGNTILRRRAFKVCFGSCSETDKTVCESGMVNGIQFKVYDTKGFQDTRMPPDAAHSWDLPKAGIGIDVFLFVKRWGSFLDQDLHDLLLFGQLTGDGGEQQELHKTVLVFTHVENDQVQDDLENNQSSALKKASALVHSVVGVDNVNGKMAAQKLLTSVIQRIKQGNPGEQWTWSQQKFEELFRGLEKMVEDRQWNSQTRKYACLRVLSDLRTGKCTIAEAWMKLMTIKREEEMEEQRRQEQERSWQEESERKQQQWQQEHNEEQEDFKQKREEEMEEQRRQEQERSWQEESERKQQQWKQEHNEEQEDIKQKHQQWQQWQQGQSQRQHQQRQEEQSRHRAWWYAMTAGLSALALAVMFWF